MADSQGSVHLSGNAATAVPSPLTSTKSPLIKQTEAKGAPDCHSQTSRNFTQPPPKKVRVEERSVKPKKLNREGGVGGNGGGKEKLQQPTKQQSYGSSTGLWSLSQVKTSSSNPPVLPTGGLQPPTNTHKVFKQSDFFLHKAPSSSKPSKQSKDEQREREKGKGCGEEEKKQKLLVTFGSESNINASNNNNNISRFNNISAVKRENGEVMLPPKVWSRSVGATFFFPDEEADDIHPSSLEIIILCGFISHQNNKRRMGASTPVWTCVQDAQSQGHLESRTEGGDCNVTSTDGVGTGRLKSTKSVVFVRKPRSHQATMSATNHRPED